MLIKLVFIWAVLISSLTVAVREVEAEEQNSKLLEKVGVIQVQGGGPVIDEMLFAGDGQTLFIHSNTHDIGLPMYLHQWKKGQSTIAQKIDSTGYTGNMFAAPHAMFEFRRPKGFVLSNDPKHLAPFFDSPGDRSYGTLIGGSVDRGFVVTEQFGMRRSDAHGKLRVFDIKSHEQRYEIESGVVVRALAISADGSRIAAVGLPLESYTLREQPENSNSSVLQVWDAETGLRVYVRNLGYDARALQFAPSSNHRLLAAGFADEFLVNAQVACVSVIETIRPAWSQSYELDSQRPFETAVCFVTPDLVAVGTGDRRFKLIDFAKQNILLDLKSDQDGVASILLDGDRLYTGGKDGTISIWKVNLENN